MLGEFKTLIFVEKRKLVNNFVCGKSESSLMT